MLSSETKYLKVSFFNKSDQIIVSKYNPIVEEVQDTDPETVPARETVYRDK